MTLADLGLEADVLARVVPGAFAVIDDDGRFAYANPSAAELLGRPAEHLIGEPYTRFLDAVVSPRQRVRLRGEIDAVATLVDLSEAHRKGPQGGDFRVLVLVDVTEVTRSRRHLDALREISARLTLGGDVRAVLDSVAASVCTASGCLGCSVVLFEPDPLRLVLAGYYNLTRGHNEVFEEACRRGFPLAAIDAFRTGVARIRNGARDTVTAIARELGPPYPEYAANVPWDTIVALPLRWDGVPTGALNCFYAGTVSPSHEEMCFLQSIADQASMVVENARLFAQAEGRAILEERQRLARELHDSVSQALYGISLGARTALQRLDVGAAAREPVEFVLSLASSGLAEMRALIFELRPEALESEGLVVTLQQQLDATAAHYKLDIQSALGAEPPLDPARREALYRVAREALTNSVKHASASKLEVKLESADGRAVLTVHDNGSGFDPTERFPGHLGLTTMRERMQRVGGSLVLESAPGRGTRLRAEVPLLVPRP